MLVVILCKFLVLGFDKCSWSLKFEIICSWFTIYGFKKYSVDNFTNSRLRYLFFCGIVKLILYEGDLK